MAFLGQENSLTYCFVRIQGKAKKNAWQKVVDEGISAETAQERYVALVEQLKAKLGFDENKIPEVVG